MKDHNNQTVETISTQTENKPNSITIKEKNADTETESNMTGKKTLFEFQPWMNLVIKFPEGKDDILLPRGYIHDDKVHLLRKPYCDPKGFSGDNDINASCRYYFGVEENNSNIRKTEIVKNALATLLLSEYSMIDWREDIEGEFIFQYRASTGICLPLGLKFFFCNSSEIEEVKNNFVLRNNSLELLEILPLNFIYEDILDRLPIDNSVKKRVYNDLLKQCEYLQVTSSSNTDDPPKSSKE